MATTTPLDHLKSAKRPITKRLRLAWDEEAADAVEAEREKIERMRIMARSGGLLNPGEMEAAEARLAAAEAVAQEHSVVFTFQALGRRSYERLLNKHQPTPEQLKEWEAQGNDPNSLTWNTDTFPQALIAACLVEPQLSEDEVNELFDSPQFNSAEVFALFTTAQECNQVRRIIELGNG